MTEIDVARRFWDAYCASAGGVSKFTGDPLPEWDAVDSDIREHWRAVAREAEDVFDCELLPD